jgi:hypothetical protein
MPTKILFTNFRKSKDLTAFSSLKIFLAPIRKKEWLTFTKLPKKYRVILFHRVLQILLTKLGTDGGVRITKESVNERGTGMTVGDAVATEAERMRTIWHDYNVLPTAPLGEHL